MSLINFYELQGVKSLIDSGDDKQYQYTRMKINTRMLFAGASGTGKSNALLNYIYLTSKPRDGTFRHIFIISKTGEALYEFLQSEMKGFVSIYKTLEELPSVKEFPDKTKENYKWLVILDDCITDKDKKNVKKMEEYFAFSRKKNITTIFLSQSYFQTPIFIRQNINYLVLTSIRGRKDLSRIMKEYETPHVSSQQFQAMFDDATRQNMNFFKVDLQTTDIMSKFSKNFDEFYNPNNFQNGLPFVYGVV